MTSTTRFSSVVIVLGFSIAPAMAGPPPEPNRCGEGTPVLELVEVGPIGFLPPEDIDDITATSPDVPTFAEGNIARDPSVVPIATTRVAFPTFNRLLANDGLYGMSNGYSGGGQTLSTNPGGDLSRCNQVSCRHPDAVPTGHVACGYIGFYWPDAPQTIAEVALARENVGQWVIGNDPRGNYAESPAYLFQYTTDTFTPKGCASPQVETPFCDDSSNYDGVTWINLGIANNHQTGRPAERGMRSRYRLQTPVTGVRALRVVGRLNDRITEIEVGDAPNTLGDPPSTILRLRETGGPYTTPAATTDVPLEEHGNLAQGVDAVPFASSAAGVDNLADGAYGNASTWVGADGATSGITYAGIYFDENLTPDMPRVEEVAVGRDNTGALNDLVSGTHIVEYTQDTFDPTDDASVAGATWLRPTKYEATGHLDSATACKGLRRVYVLNYPVEARAVRVVTDAGNALDELELGRAFVSPFKPPGEPLAEGGMGGLIVDELGHPAFPELQLAVTAHPNPGGPITTPALELDVPGFGDGNMAQAPDAVPFSSPPQVRGINSVSSATDLIDGRYGDSDAWVGIQVGDFPKEMYVGVYWTGGLKRISQIAIGRDNTGLASNRHLGPFVVHYTQQEMDFEFNGVAEPAIGTAKWIAVGLLRDHQAADPPLLRRLYDFEAPVDARAIRVTTRPINSDRTYAVGNAFDELETIGTDIGGLGEDCRAGGAQTLPGDCNEDGDVDLSDAVCLLGFLFQNDPAVLPCNTTEAGAILMNANGDDPPPDLSDAVYILTWLFGGGPPHVLGQECTAIPDCPQNEGCE